LLQNKTGTISSSRRLFLAGTGGCPQRTAVPLQRCCNEAAASLQNDFLEHFHQFWVVTQFEI
jgi:hypothetical protein